MLALAGCRLGGGGWAVKLLSPELPVELVKAPVSNLPVELVKTEVSNLPVEPVETEHMWRELRESKMYLMAVKEDWQGLDSKSTRRLEKEERQIRLEIMRRKKTKYGKAGNSKLTRIEESILIRETRRKSELEEVRQNINMMTGIKHRKKTEKGQEPKIPEGRKIVPEGRKETVNPLKKSEQEEQELERQWYRLRTCLQYIETHEPRISANRLENSSLVEQEVMLHGLGQMDGEGGVRTKVSTNADWSQENIKKTSRRQMTSQVEDYKAQEPPDSVENDEEMRKKNTAEDTGRQKPSDRIVDVDFEEDTVTCRRLDDQDENTPVLVKNLLTTKFGKIGEMRHVILRKDSAAKSEMRCQERSPGRGRVMKKRGTPSKTSKVRNLKKFFEISTSSPTRGDTELLLQSSLGIRATNLLATTTTTQDARLKLNFCVDQPGVAEQTGPRQMPGWGNQLGQDWATQTRLGPGDQPQHLYQGWGGGG